MAAWGFEKIGTATALLQKTLLVSMTAIILYENKNDFLRNDALSALVFIGKCGYYYVCSHVISELTVYEDQQKNRARTRLAYTALGESNRTKVCP
jgi:hypothetical protein